jgi:beta-galactosidase GanA
MKEVKRVFTVNGKPFYPLGGQADNASGYNNDESETAFKAMQLIDGNTLEIPVYWEILEPEESKFDFSSVDSLIAKGRRYGIKLILLWYLVLRHHEFCPEVGENQPGPLSTDYIVYR